MEAALVDQSDGAPWGCPGTHIAFTKSFTAAIGSGEQNTADILAACPNRPWIAAAIADVYSLNGYDDWFLPSRDELLELYRQRNVVGGFADGCYWDSSPTSTDSSAASCYYFTGVPGVSNRGVPQRVRAIRTF